MRLRRIDGDWWQIQDVNGAPIADVMGAGFASFIQECLQKKTEIKEFLKKFGKKHPRNEL